MIYYSTDLSQVQVLDPQRSKTLNISLMESTVKIDDNKYDIFKVIPEWQSRFIEFAKSWEYSTSWEAGDEYLRIFFLADSKQMLYAREDYSLLVYLGDIGGLLDFVLIFGWALSHKFVLRMLQAALVGRVYRLQHYMRDMTPYYKTRVPGQTTPPDEWSDTPSSSGSSSSKSGSSSSSSSWASYNKQAIKPEISQSRHKSEKHPKHRKHNSVDPMQLSKMVKELHSSVNFQRTPEKLKTKKRMSAMVSQDYRNAI